MTPSFRLLPLSLIAITACAFGQGHSHRDNSDSSDRSSSGHDSRSSGHTESRSSNSRPSFSYRGSSPSSGNGYSRGSSGSRYNQESVRSPRSYSYEPSYSPRSQGSPFQYQSESRQVQEQRYSGRGNSKKDSSFQSRNDSQPVFEQPRARRGNSRNNAGFEYQNLSQQVLEQRSTGRGNAIKESQQAQRSPNFGFQSQGTQSQGSVLQRGGHSQSGGGSFTQDGWQSHASSGQGTSSLLQRGNGPLLRQGNLAGFGFTPPPPVRQLPINLQAGSLRNQVLTQESISLSFGGFRFGYTQFSPGFRDSFFFGRNYLFDPCGPRYVFSPWYYYPCLPPYLLWNNVYIVSQPSYGDGYYYNWHSRHYYDDDYRYRHVNQRELDDAIADLRDAFVHEDMNPVRYLVPRDGRVAIYMDHSYKYSVRADDFYDMLRDAVEHTRTNNLEIVDVRTYDDGAVKIVARHETSDPWDRDSHVYQTYRLCQEDGHYVIREFGTSYDR